MNRSVKIFYLFLCFVLPLSAQNSVEYKSNYGFDVGFSGKLQIEFGVDYNPNFKLSLSAGVGYNSDKVNIFPTIHTGLILFNRGPIGSVLNSKWHHIQSHFFYSAIGTLRLDNKDFTFNERHVPLYHFSDFTANPLQNPYKSSLSFGAIWVKMPKEKQQSIGFFNANVVSRIQVSYYNDGGPVLNILGDKHDRYYTGGVVLSYHGDLDTELNLIEVSYHKFTGYSKHAFDVGDKLQIDYLVYAKKQEFAFNQQRWRINMTNLNSGYGGFISFYDFNAFDIQDALHFSTNVPYHPDFYQKPRIMIGGRYQRNSLYLSR